MAGGATLQWPPSVGFYGPLGVTAPIESISTFSKIVGTGRVCEFTYMCTLHAAISDVYKYKRGSQKGKEGINEERTKGYQNHYNCISMKQAPPYGFFFPPRAGRS